MKKFFYIVFGVVFFNVGIFSSEIIVYCASDLVYAMEEIHQTYSKMYPEDKVKMIFGSSGKGYTQILHNAPYDVALMADMEYLRKLKEKGLVQSEIKPYAIGRIVIWKRKDVILDLNKGIEVVLDPEVKKIAIANWNHAPYGIAAKECLEYYHLFDKVKNKFVFGDNIAHTAQFVQLGGADIGFIALSISLSKKLQEEGEYYLLPTKCHSEIMQGYAILKNATTNLQKYNVSKRFYNFISTKEARNIFIKYGFILPGERVE